MADSWVLLRWGDRRQADEWALVLASAGTASRVEQTTRGWAVLVAEGNATRASGVLSAYDADSRATPTPVEAFTEYGPSVVAIVVAVLLIAFYLHTGPRTLAGVWFLAGSASASRILGGESWRAVTALTLHANLPHVLGNAVALCVFGTAVVRAVGPGVGLWLLLLAGSGGNLLNAILRQSGHSSVGASTAVFGSLGILGALQMVRRRRGHAAGWRAWTPIAAALAILALLGTGTDSDVLAHLFGFVTGSALGGLIAITLPQPMPSATQWPLVAGAALVVAACWAAALTG